LKPQQFVAVHQRRTARDYIAPPGAVQAARPQSTQDYLLLARTGPADTPYYAASGLKQAHDEQGVLSGTIVVVGHDKNPVVRARRRRLNADIRQLLDQQSCYDVDPEKVLDQLCDRIRVARLDGIACLSME